MSSSIFVQIIFFFIFAFLFCWQTVLLFAIRNAKISSKIKPPFGWLVLAIIGALFSAAILASIFIHLLTF